MKVLVTGAAGFIGSHVSRTLLERGVEVVGVDNFSDYTDVALKQARVRWVAEARPGWSCRVLDLAERSEVAALFADEAFDAVIHLAAQAGVRYSLENPQAYLDANFQGFLNVLEGCRQHPVQHLVYASSSSVYGANRAMPYTEQQPVNHPLSLYAASKKANELMAHSYSHLYRIPTTGLRFFTVYGPWGRPDMAPIKFARMICAGETIPVFSGGQHRRDFTYIDDIVAGILCVLEQPPCGDLHWDGERPDPATSAAPWRVLNIGNQQPVGLMDFIRCLESALGKSAQLEFLPPQPGDVPDTWADVSALQAAVGYRPDTPLHQGIDRFAAWFQSYYGNHQ